MEILTSVSETALFTLRSRVIESGKKNALIKDPMGREILDKLYTVMPAEARKRIFDRKLSPVLTVHLALRARKYDAYAGEFIRKHPAGIIVNLGCGFDSRYWRISAKPAQYVEIDLPGVINAKQQILGKAMEYTAIGCSVLDLQWIEEIAARQRREILFLAEGLFMYLPGQEVQALFKKIAGTFTGSEIVFEAVNAAYIKGIMKKVLENKMKHQLGSDAGSSFQFGIKDAREIETYAGNLKVLEEWSYFEDDDIKPGIFKLFRNSRFFTRGQWTVRAAIGQD